MSGLYSLNGIFYASLENNYLPSRYRRHVFESSNKTKFMLIPLTDRVFEVPSFALSNFLYMLCEDNSPDGIIPYTDLCIILKTEDRSTTYASIDTKVRDVLSVNYDNGRLIKLKTKEGIIYYGTNSALFTADFTPIVLLSWRFAKSFLPDGSVKFQPIQPILRVEPSIFTEKGDELQRYVINKIIPEALITEVYSSAFGSDRFICDTSKLSPKVVVNEIPFILKDAEQPSSSTTNKELLNIALANIEEIMQ